MKRIQQLLEDRILIIDGAMGTMIQRHQLQEVDYRGDRFKDWPSDVKGNNDLLSITQARIITDIHNEEHCRILANVDEVDILQIPLNVVENY